MKSKLADCEFSLSPDNSFEVTDEVKKCYKENGFIIVKGFLTEAELQKTTRVLEAENSFVWSRIRGMDDGMGKKSKLVLWNQPGDDVTGMIARSEKLVNLAEELLGGEVYHYHSKLVTKEAFEGGSHVWHQDYGYWYLNGCLWPTMNTIFIPLDKATEENGCLRIIPKSHHLGRVDHIAVGEQVGADPERVAHILKAMGGEVPVEMDAGDALIFDCNLLHTSAQNLSPLRRWALLVSYNTAANNPVKVHHHPQYTPLQKVPTSAILDCPDDAPMGRKDFLVDNKDDVSVQAVLTAKEQSTEK